MIHILVVDDDKNTRLYLRAVLEEAGYTVTEAENGEDALAAMDRVHIDLVVLDIMMPKLNGLSVCRELRKHSDVPIIFLTALSDEEDKLLGYELGADDYVTKPYSMAVLYAKLMALINRSRGHILSGDLIAAGPIRIRVSAQQVWVADMPIALTPKEYALLLCLVRNRGMVLSREQLLIKCWGYDYEGDSRAVDTHIKRLREKLGSASACIKTVIKSGYKLEV